MKAVIIDFNRTIFNPEKQILNNGAVLMLDALKNKNFTLFLISRGNSKRFDLIRKLGLFKYFQEILVVSEKKESDFRNIVTKFKIKPPKSFVIGDRVKKEILLGNRCGLQTIWFRNGKFANEIPRLTKEKPNYVIENLKEVIRIIK